MGIILANSSVSQCHSEGQIISKWTVGQVPLHGLHAVFQLYSH